MYLLARLKLGFDAVIVYGISICLIKTEYMNASDDTRPLNGIYKILNPSDLLRKSIYYV